MHVGAALSQKGLLEVHVEGRCSHFHSSRSTVVLRPLLVRRWRSTALGFGLGLGVSGGLWLSRCALRWGLVLGQWPKYRLALLHEVVQEGELPVGGRILLAILAGHGLDVLSQALGRGLLGRQALVLRHIVLGLGLCFGLGLRVNDLLLFLHRTQGLDLGRWLLGLGQAVAHDTKVEVGEKLACRMVAASLEAHGMLHLRRQDLNLALHPLALLHLFELG
mmetsp:Transcript_73023/g.156376  ORF Transcript_73023/g.156376 Transcript_73023/m.156376 type:complete len:220 (+) Transcript_73023:1628-2287(+)